MALMSRSSNSFSRNNNFELLLSNGIGWVTLGRSSAEIQPVGSVPGLYGHSVPATMQHSWDCAKRSTIFIQSLLRVSQELLQFGAADSDGRQRPCATLFGPNPPPPQARPGVLAGGGGGGMSKLTKQSGCVHSRQQQQQQQQGRLENTYELFNKRDHQSEMPFKSESATAEYSDDLGGSAMRQQQQQHPFPAQQQQQPHNSVVNQQGIKNLVHDVQLKRQKEIRDMMKKKREKAVLVDRISRWLFPTSFILLNIVYWALFGDHDLW